MWLIFDENIVLLIVASQKTINNPTFSERFFDLKRKTSWAI